MRFRRYCIGLLVSSLFSSTIAQSLAVKKERIDELSNLNLPYTISTPPDSVINWKKELEQAYVERKDWDGYFLLQCSVSFSYTLKGEHSKALETADQMLKKAEECDFDRGRAIAFLAIGHAFIYAGMENEGLEAMATSINYFETLPRYDRIGVLFIYIPQLCKAGRIEEARKGLAEMKPYFDAHPEKSPFRYLICQCYVDLYSGEMQKFEQTLQQCAHLPEIESPYFRYLLQSVETDYRIATGDYEKALRLLDSCGSYLDQTQSGRTHEELLRKRISILSATGRKQEAIEKYQSLFDLLEANKATYYTRLVHSIHTNYNAYRMEAKNQERRNQTILLSIIGSFLLILVGLFVLFRIKKQNRILKERRSLLEEARRKAEESTLNKNLFLSNMTHDIRTPLNALTGFSELLTETKWDETTRSLFYDLIQSNSTLLLKLIDDIVDLSNLKTGKMEFCFAPHDGVELCRHVVQTIMQIKQTDAAIHFETSFSKLELITDDARLQQLLINLLINATKFTTIGTITLRLEKQDQATALFSVTDTGCGVNPKQQVTIFDRFEKENEQSSGFGIGLSICKLIVERINGHIWLDSEYQDGARFLFTHPINPQNQSNV